VKCKLKEISQRERRKLCNPKCRQVYDHIVAKIVNPYFTLKKVYK
jgi:hypothetical protein